MELTNSTPTFQSQNAFVLGLSLFLTCFFTLFFSNITFLLEGTINPLIFPLAIATSLIIIYWRRNVFWGVPSDKPFLFLCAKSLFLISLSLIIAYLFWDYSNDGNYYHKNTIYELSIGWNPIFHYHSSNTLGITPNWSELYNKGAETIASAIYSTTGLSETGKAFNYMLTFSALLFTYNTLFLFKSDIRKFRAALYSLLVVACPVVLGQLNTYYIDWTGYILAIIVATNCYRLLKLEKPISTFRIECWIISLSISLAIAIKMNIAFWICISIAAAGLYFAIIKRHDIVKIGSGFCIAGFALGFCFFCFNPYLHNIKNNRHVFYPLAGEQKNEKIIGDQTPQILQSHNRAYHVIFSLSSLPNNEKKHYTQATTLDKINRGIFLSGNFDTRLGGWGLCFFEVLILALLLFVLSKSNKHRPKYIIAIFGLFAGSLILPAGFWARYYPFFYFIPILCLLYNEKYGSRFKSIKYLKYALILALIFNSSLSEVQALKQCTTFMDQRKDFVTKLQHNAPVRLKIQGDAGLFLTLKDQNIPYIPCDTASYPVPSPCQVFIVKEDLEY